MTAKCPICHSNTPIVLEQRARVPLLQNRVWPDRTSARTAPAGVLDFVLCAACGFGWNRLFNRSVVYDQAYNNDQMGSSRFRSHVAEMVERILMRAPSGHPIHLVEVGCGQGALLTGLASRKCFSSLTGFDPAWRGEDGVEIDGITIYRRYFGPNAIDLLPRGSLFVVSRHTIEHVVDPLSFLRGIRTAMATTVDGRLFLETPDVEHIVEKFQPQDLFYEHCSIFSGESLHVALAAAGFESLLIERVFEGQYLWAEARPAVGEVAIAGSCKVADAAEAFTHRLECFILDWRDRTARMAANGTVYLWGAASKGVTFALLVDPDGIWLSGAIDINRDKIGSFMPGSGLPILAPSVLQNGDCVIVMNPNYFAEIANQISNMGISAGLACIDDVKHSELQV